MERVPFIFFGAQVTSITVDVVLWHHTTLIFTNSVRAALKLLTVLWAVFFRDSCFTALVRHVLGKVFSVEVGVTTWSIRW